MEYGNIRISAKGVYVVSEMRRRYPYSGGNDAPAGTMDALAAEYETLSDFSKMRIESWFDTHPPAYVKEHIGALVAHLRSIENRPDDATS